MLTADSSFDEVAAAIIQETVRRGYSRAESIACLSDAIQESGLRMVWSKNGLWFGYYQQDGGYPNRMDPMGNIIGFLDRLDVKRRSPGASPDPFKNIFWLQQRPSEVSADEAYNDPAARRDYYDEIRRHIDQATELYDRFLGGTLMRPDFTEIPMFGKGSGVRSRPPINFFIHTEEGNSNAEALARFCQGQNNVSYHYTLRDRIVYDVVNTDLYSWSVLDANVFSINLCFAGSSANMTRDQWLARIGDIEIAAYIAVRDARKYRFSTEVIVPPYGNSRPGISDHKYVTQALHIGTHLDVGNNFPWDVFVGFVNKYANPTVPNAIAEAYKAAPWLGAKLTKEVELPTADGRGRFAAFENGYIYWSPDTGAYPIPRNLFEAYAKLGWEAGPLGYPTRFFTVVPNVGDIQAFQGGVLYRKYGVPDGFYIHGKIGDYFAAQGFEGGPLGWPTSNEGKFSGGVYQDFENGRALFSPSGVVAVKHPAVFF